jgi:hypothetical protein
VLDELARLAHAVEELADPEQGVEVAQAPLALLHVRLEQEAAIAQPLVALVALRQLRLDEVGAVAGDDLLLVGPDQLLVEMLRTPHEPGLEQRRADREVALGELHAFGHRAHGLADLQAEVPELVEQELGQLLDQRRALVGHRKSRSTSEPGASSPRP